MNKIQTTHFIGFTLRILPAPPMSVQPPDIKINVENFGPIQEAYVDLRPLTLLVGPSNTGKTYFASLIYALHNAFNGLTHSSLLSPLGSEKIMAVLRQLLNGNSPARQNEIQEVLNKLAKHDIPFKLADVPTELRKKLRTILERTEFFGAQLQALEDELKNCFDLESVAELNRWNDGQLNGLKIRMETGGQEEKYWEVKITSSESKVNIYNSESLENPIYDNIVLLPTRWSPVGKLYPDENRVEFSKISYPSAPNRYYLPAARSGIMQSHRIIASSLVTRATRAGLERLPEVPTMSGIISDFMQKIILYDEKKNPDAEMKNLAEILETEVLDGQIHFKPAASGYPDFLYSPQGTEKEIRLNQTSSMVSELAPLVLFLRGLIRPGDMLIIEEPEAHLHPGAQADMAVILARLVRVGVHVIITTHSDWLLEEIGNLIRVGELEKIGNDVRDLSDSLQKEQVGVWRFQKDGKVEEIAYDHINGVEPMEYLDVAEDLYNRSARLQNRLEETKGESKRECDQSS